MLDDKEKINTDSYVEDIKKALGYTISIILVMWLLSVFVVK